MTESINNQPEALDGDLTGSIAYPGTEYLEGAKNVSEGHAEAPSGISEDSKLDKLKNEAAQSRIKLKETEARLSDVMERLQALSVEHATRDLLPNGAEHLGWSDEWQDQDGYPSGDLIREAAQQLLDVRPELGRVRGQIGAGEHGGTSGTPSLGELLRRAAGGS